jgi:hypothetical protein
MRAWLTVGILGVWLPASLIAQNRPGEVNTPPARGERKPDTLKVGDLAPDFTLTDLTGKNTFTLSHYRGQKPVVLIFGSYT